MSQDQITLAEKEGRLLSRMGWGGGWAEKGGDFHKATWKEKPVFTSTKLYVDDFVTFL